MDRLAPATDPVMILPALDPILTDESFWSLSERPAPIDLAVECARAMEAARFVKAGTTYVQTIYTVLLAPADAARFRDRSRELIAALKDALIWWSDRGGYEAPGELRVKIQPDNSLAPGQISVEAGLRPEEVAKLGSRP